MLIDDIDYEVKFSTGSLKISELTDMDLDEIRAIAKLIMKENHFRDEIQALISAYYLFVDAYIETNQESEQGRRHH